MSADPNIARCYPIADSELRRRSSQAHPVGGVVMHAQELHTSVDGAGRERVFRCHENIGRTYFLGTVGSEAEMIALDQASLAMPPGDYAACLPGDTCYRSDLRRYYRCISGYGLAAEDWEQLPAAITAADLADATAWGRARLADADAASAKAALAIEQSDVAGLVAALGAKATVASPSFTGSPTAPTPTSASGLATKQYVDAAVASVGGLVPWRLACVESWYSWESPIAAADGSPPADGVAVRAIIDLGRYPDVAAQTDAALRPIWVSAAVNGIGAIKLPAGGFHRLTVPSVNRSSRGLFADRTLFILGRRSSLSGWAIFSGSVETGADSVYSYAAGSSPYGLVSGGVDWVATSYVPDTGWHLWEWQVRGTTATLYVDGVFVQSVSAAPTYPSSSVSLEIGNYAASYGGAFAQGGDVYLAARVMVAGTATTAQLSAIREYLRLAAGL